MAVKMEGVREFALVAFVLLGVLFGMMIMNFIFGILGPDTIPSPDNVLGVNTSGAYINATVYNITEASSSEFNGGFTVILAVNSSSSTEIASGNYTVDSTAGTITNATAVVWDNVTLTYTYNSKSVSTLSSEIIQNNSLQAIIVYTEGADTQMSTVSIAIILGLLIAVFLLFWGIFVKKKGSVASGGSFG